MRKVLGLITFLLLVLLTTRPDFSAPKKELDAVIADNAKGVTAESKDFIIIKFQIIKIVGHKNEEILATPVMRCENGKNASMRFGSQQGFSITLELIPEIVEDKDIRLKLSAQVEPGMSKTFKRELLVKNNHSMVVELFRNEKDNSQILAQITPEIEKFLPAREYPQPVLDLDWGETMVLFNDRLVARGNIDVRDADGVYLRFWKSGSYFFSFHHFPGARQLGFCEGNSVKFHLDKDIAIEWFTTKPPLPQGKWLAWCANEADISNESNYKNAKFESVRVEMSKEGEIGIWRLNDQVGESPAAAALDPLDNKMDFEFKNGNLKGILEFVAKILNAKLSLDLKLNEKKFSCDISQVPLRQFLDLVCKVNGAKWQFTKGEPSVLQVESL